ncbi:MAG: hypothetical protein ACI3V4_03970 [Faecousia sp.]
MDANELPLGFGFALAQNPEAMRNFALLPESQRAQILHKVHAVSSKEEMQSLVDSLTVQ